MGTILEHGLLCDKVLIEVRYYWLYSRKGGRALTQGAGNKEHNHQKTTSPPVLIISSCFVASICVILLNAWNCCTLTTLQPLRAASPWNSTKPCVPVLSYMIRYYVYIQNMYTIRSWGNSPGRTIHQLNSRVYEATIERRLNQNRCIFTFLCS